LLLAHGTAPEALTTAEPAICKNPTQPDLLDVVGRA